MKTPDERIADALERIADALEAELGDYPATDKVIEHVAGQPASTAALTAKAEYNRDNAERLYGLKLYLARDGSKGIWSERESGKPVVFTPYGWRLQEDVEAETQGTLK